MRFDVRTCSHWFALWAVALLAACMVDDVTFSRGEPVLSEDCSREGDEDDNGMADCADAVCASSPRCAVSPAVCPNGAKEAGEACDDDGMTASCDADCSLPACNDGVFNSLAEDADPPSSPSQVAPMSDQTCRYDFREITQMYCAGNCSWAGAVGCQQVDADVLCKIKTGNSRSTAITFMTGPTQAAPGICCPNLEPEVTGCTDLGVLRNRDVALRVAVHETNMSITHGTGQAVVSVTCSTP